MNINRYMIISLIIGLIIIGNQPMPQIVEADLDLNASRQSDIMTSPHNSTYFLTATGSTQFRNMSDNSFLASIDLLTLGEDVMSIYDIRFRFIFRNLDLNFSIEFTSPKTGTLTAGQMFYEELFTVSVDETFPEYLNISVAFRYTENMESGDEDSGVFFANMFNVQILDDIPPSTAELRPPSIEETTTIITETEDVFAPYVSNPPKGFSAQVGTDYNITWQVNGDLPRNYRVNVSDGRGTIQTLQQGSWTDGQIITMNSVNQTEEIGIYHYTLELDNELDQLYFSNTTVIVMNQTEFCELFPEACLYLGDQFDLPFPFIGVMTALIGITMYRRKKSAL